MGGLNYYNYFTEIEEHFVRRRKKNLLVSPLDWSLIETWKEAEIPLHVVLRGIDRAFDIYDAKPVKTRSVNSIFYCHQEVLAAFEEYREAHVGAGPAEESAPASGSAEPALLPASGDRDRQRVLDFLSLKVKEIEHAKERIDRAKQPDFVDILSRALARLQELSSEISTLQSQALDHEALERDLAAIDQLIVDAAAREVGDELLKTWNDEAKKELKTYRKNLSKETYEKILRNYIHKRIRQHYDLPALSLFYA
jgi:hypothetical protein